MKLKPVNDHIIIKPAAAQEMTKSGIVLPGTADKEKPEKGEVIAVGPGRLLDTGQRAPMSVAVGDTVVFKKYAPDEVTIDGEEFLVIAENDVIAVVA